MLFNSINYFVFLASTLLVFYVIPVKYRWVVLLISSIIFYIIGGINNLYVPILITLISYISGIYINKSNDVKKKKLILYFGIILNILMLIFFKYINFLLSIIFDLSKVFNIKFSNINDPIFLNIIIPLGISFITFQAISYLIDVYDGKMKPEKHLGFFSTYIIFFPKVISGPVERAINFIPQFYENKLFDYDNFVDGLKRIVWGLFKKLVIANRLAIYTEAVFNNYTHHNSFTLLVAAILYTFQLYADFSGYTDIAIGSAKLFGFKLSENFNRPLFALSITEFWRKWHITLTTWVTDYIFNPIIIKKRYWNNWGVVYSTIITFLILGLWHGSNWTFLFFGLIHGLAISIEFLTKKKRRKIRKKFSKHVNTVFGIFYTILLFSFSMIYFNSQSIGMANEIIARIFTNFSGSFFLESPSTLIYGVFSIVLLMIYELNQEFRISSIKLFNNSNWFVQQLSFVSLIILILLIGVFDGGQFIYFQF